MERREARFWTPAEIAARVMIPGRALHRLAARVCSPKMLERVVEPAIADLQSEYAGEAHRPRSRRVWILVTGYLAVMEVIAMTALEPPLTANEERRALVRTFFWSAAGLASAGALLVALALAQMAYVGTSVLTHVGYVAPQALPLAIPVSLTLGIAFGLTGAATLVRARKVVFLVALLASAISFGTMGWVMPSANQSYRQALLTAKGGRGASAEGSGEMTLVELGREARTARGSGQLGTARELEWAYHVRWALSVATIVLTVFAFALMSRGVTRRAVILSTCAIYFILLFVAGRSVFEGLSPSVGAWLPNLMFGVAAIALRRDLTVPARSG